METLSPWANQLPKITVFEKCRMAGKIFGENLTSKKKKKKEDELLCLR